MRINTFPFIVVGIALCSHASAKDISLREAFIDSLCKLADQLVRLQDLDSASATYGALYCEACDDFHTRASEAVLPFAVAYQETGDEKFLISAVANGEWLIGQQKADGSWLETPEEWTGTTTDQLLTMAAAYPLLERKLSKPQRTKWLASIKSAADWLVDN